MKIINSPMLVFMAVLLSSPFCVLFVHALLVRSMGRRSPQKTAIRASIIAAIPVATLLYYFVFQKHPEYLSTGTIAYSSLIYSSLAYTYFHLFNMSETARRIRILFEFSKRGPMSHESVMECYNMDDVLQIRLKRLIALNQLKYEDGYYSIDGHFLYRAAIIIAWWRKILRFDQNFKPLQIKLIK